MSPAEVARLRAALRGCTIGREIISLDETTSTNDVARQLGTNGATEGVVVFAETQTAGRGRYGRRWDSGRGLGLWLSILLRPNITVSDSAGLTSWMADAIAATIEQQLALRCSVKAPNDVLIRGAKVAGVLVEMCAQRAGHFAVAGIGLNVDQTEFPAYLRETATSLRIATGQPIDRVALAIALLKRLDASYQSFRAANRDRPAAKSRMA